MTNREIRSWYLREVAKIAALDKGWQERGDSLEDRARQAWRRRHDLRLRAREMMEDPAEVELLRARDLMLYGDSGGPTFDDLVDAGLSKGLEGAQALGAILRSALSTDESVNKLFGL